MAHSFFFNNYQSVEALSVAVQQNRLAHAENVLYVDQPAIKAVIVADVD